MNLHFVLSLNAKTLIMKIYKKAKNVCPFRPNKKAASIYLTSQPISNNFGINTRYILRENQFTTKSQTIHYHF